MADEGFLVAGRVTRSGGEAGEQGAGVHGLEVVVHDRFVMLAETVTRADGSYRLRVAGRRGVDRTAAAPSR